MERADFLENIENREDRGSTIANNKLQAQVLCNFVQEYFIDQYIETSTRGKNLLDLMFCCNSDSITHNIS